MIDFHVKSRHAVLMVQVSISSLEEFLSRRPFSIIHVDANWDGHRQALADRICNLEARFEISASFGYMDCGDQSNSDYLKKINIVNVPSVAYYGRANLFVVVIGLEQDIAGNIDRLLKGEPLA